MGRTKRAAVSAALAVAVLCLSPAAEAQSPFGMLKGLVPNLPNMPTAPKPAPATSGASSSGQMAPGAMGMREPTPLAPLHGLGTDAVAVVENASPGAPVHAMDYVFARQSIGLGPKGSVTLSHLTGCLTETFQGGVVVVAQSGSRVTGGKRTDRATPGCHAATPVLLASASEAGATVNRITPFTGVNWNERALKSAKPVFKWDRAAGAASLRVKDMDKEGEPVLWQAEAPADKDWIAYPPTAAKLAPGMPYKVQAMAGGKVVAEALFSIDPALDVADNMAGRVVPLSTP